MKKIYVCLCSLHKNSCRKLWHASAGGGGLLSYKAPEYINNQSSGKTLYVVRFHKEIILWKNEILFVSLVLSDLLKEKSSHYRRFLRIWC